jgi:hypothetical protein
MHNQAQNAKSEQITKAKESQPSRWHQQTTTPQLNRNKLTTNNKER